VAGTAAVEAGSSLVGAVDTLDLDPATAVVAAVVARTGLGAGRAVAPAVGSCAVVAETFFYTPLATLLRTRVVMLTNLVVAITIPIRRVDFSSPRPYGIIGDYTVPATNFFLLFPFCYSL